MAGLSGVRVLVYGGGELGTAVAHRFRRVGMDVAIVEPAEPTAVCRALSLAFAVYDGKVEVDGLRGQRSDGVLSAEDILARGEVPVLVEPSGLMIERLKPAVLVDATGASAVPFRLGAAPVTVALGPGRTAGREVLAVVDTSPLLSLGKVHESGEVPSVAAAPSGMHPVRVLTAAGNGVFVADARIGEAVEVGRALATVGHYPVVAPEAGFVRGLLADGIMGYTGQAVAELWLGPEDAGCFTISPWARAVAGGALEAVARLAPRL